MQIDHFNLRIFIINFIDFKAILLIKKVEVDLKTTFRVLFIFQEQKFES